MGQAVLLFWSCLCHYHRHLTTCAGSHRRKVGFFGSRLQIFVRMKLLFRMVGIMLTLSPASDEFSRKMYENVGIYFGIGVTMAITNFLQVVFDLLQFFSTCVSPWCAVRSSRRFDIASSKQFFDRTSNGSTRTTADLWQQNSMSKPSARSQMKRGRSKFLITVTSSEYARVWGTSSDCSSARRPCLRRRWSSRSSSSGASPSSCSE